MGESKTLEALFPGSRRRILHAMFSEPARWWSPAELAGLAGTQPAAIKRDLLRMRDGGVVRESLNGGLPSYQLDSACPVYPDLQAIFNKLTRHRPGGETILVVEDQPATAQITRILLESWGYAVLEAHGGAEAIEIFGKHGGPIDLLLTDVIMPGMTGLQLADELRRRAPELRVVFMSGYPSQELTNQNGAFLPKPFNPAGLSHVIRRELDREAPRRLDLQQS